MGSFFLYKSDSNVAVGEAELVFTKKGFSSPLVFRLHDYTLLLYKKQTLSVKNYYLAPDGAGAFCVGTPIYKQLTFSDTLRQLFLDFSANQIDFDSLLGHFCILFYRPPHTTILLDPLRVFHVFATEDLSILSNSFLAVLAASPKPLRIHKEAVHEKLISGMIIGKDTYVHGIQRLSIDWTPSASNSRLAILETPISLAGPPEKGGTRPRNLHTEVNAQLRILRDYFRAARALATEYGSDLGISGGYDSRLLLLLALEAGYPLSLHTHHTLGVHEKERCIAESIASILRLPLRILPTRLMEQQDNHSLNRILMDGLYFYDARNGDNTGAFSETYTNLYKTATLGNNGLRLNGEGGEIYRNSFCTRPWLIDFSSWLITRAYYPLSRHIFIGNDIFRNTHLNILRKISNRFSQDLSKRVDFFFTRRYYAEIRLPDCEGAAHSAENQLAFFLTPYMEPSIIFSSYRATPYIRLGARFQASMISALHPQLAAVASHYGYPLNRPNVLQTLRCQGKAFLPDHVLLLRENIRVRFSGLGKELYHMHHSLLQRTPLLRTILSALKDFFPEIDFRMCFRNPDIRKTALYLGSFFSHFSPYIKP